MIVGPDRPAPEQIIVDGKEMTPHSVRPDQVEVQFTESVKPHSIKRFSVRYTQRHTGRKSVYMVTSARRWSKPIRRAVFVISHPAEWGNVQVSLPASDARQDGVKIVRTISMTNFWPAEELTVRW